MKTLTEQVRAALDHAEADINEADRTACVFVSQLRVLMDASERLLPLRDAAHGFVDAEVAFRRAEASGGGAGPEVSAARDRAFLALCSGLGRDPI